MNSWSLVLLLHLLFGCLFALVVMVLPLGAVLGLAFVES
jgi:hypothetical protein